MSVNSAALKLFAAGRKDLVGQRAPDYLKKHWKTDVPGEILKQCLEERKPVSSAFSLKGKKAPGYRLEARPCIEDTAATPLIVLSIDERSEEA